MVTLYITRHGETEWNIQKRMQGWKDSELTSKGSDNAIALGRRLHDVEFNEIYTSPSSRTVSTASYICGERQIPIVLDERLREINLGDWEGKTQDYIKGNYADDFRSFWNTPHLYTSQKGENFSQLQQRVVSVLNDIMDKHLSGNVLIVTHSVAIKSMLAYFKNMELSNIWEPPFIHDTSLTVVEVSKDGINKIILEGDIAHREDKME
jgi:broad specificity phosphatase PhoE